VKWRGHISDDELVKEYQDADVFILPSLYEGFGLPVLEAFACGTPVICSNCGSLPDTCGQAALQIDPHDTAGICEAMRKVLMDTCFAGELIKRGHKQAAKFSWQETARQTIMAYEQAVMQN
jgi:alpha-1,3-rhamnosyl/mannosyltransferase